MLYNITHTQTHSDEFVLYASKCALQFQLIIAKTAKSRSRYHSRNGRWCIQTENSFYHTRTRQRDCILLPWHAKCAIDIKSNAPILWSMAERRLETAVVHFRKLNNVNSVAHSKFQAEKNSNQNGERGWKLKWSSERNRLAVRISICTLKNQTPDIIRKNPIFIESCGFDFLSPRPFLSFSLDRWIICKCCCLCLQHYILA